MSNLRAIAIPEVVGGKIEFWAVEIQEATTSYQIEPDARQTLWRSIKRYPRLTKNEALTVYLPLAQSWVELVKTNPEKAYGSLAAV